MPQTAYDEVYENGVLVSTTQRTVSDAELERLQDNDQIRSALSLLRQWSTEAENVASQGPNVSQVQLKALFDRFGKMCRLLIRVIRVAAGEDDGI